MFQVTSPGRSQLHYASSALATSNASAGKRNADEDDGPSKKEIKIQDDIPLPRIFIPDLSSFPLNQISTQISLESVQHICNYINEHGYNILQTAFSLKQSQYIRPEASGLARAIEMTPTGRVFVHLNRVTGCGDKIIGIGASKKVSLAFELTTGRLFASASFKELTKTNELAMLQMFKGMEGFAQVVTVAVYPYKKEQVARLLKEGRLTRIFLEPQIESIRNGNDNVFKLRVVFELCDNGTLVNPASGKKFSFQDQISIFEDLVKRLAYMHRNNILHRDFKRANIFLHTQDGRLKPVVGDFGSACRVDEEEALKQLRTTSVIASPEFAVIALQMHKRIKSLACDPLLEGERYTLQKEIGELKEQLKPVTTPALDVWSLGAVLYSVLLDKDPAWPQRGPNAEMLERIIGLDDDWFPEPEEKKTPLHLVWEMLQRDPKKRISAEDAEKRLPELVWIEDINTSDIESA